VTAEGLQQRVTRKHTVKDQYVGDYNDFVKYAILRCVLEQSLPLAVCWMLTADDLSGEGGRTGYLSQPSKNHHLDPALFEFFQALVRQGNRSVAASKRAVSCRLSRSTGSGSRID
jgi:hypothetical protein